MQYFILLVSASLLAVVSLAHWPLAALPAGFKAEYIVIEKAKRQLSLYANGTPVRHYHIALGRNPIGHKLREGDNRTPEGLYNIDYKKADSAFHRALHISYPSATDSEIAAEKELNPGGQIMIHGLRNGRSWPGRLHRLRDWTAGCIALTNAEIEQLWDIIEVGTPIEIRP